jgi:hypothetical protein
MKEPGKIWKRTWIISTILFASGELLFTEGFGFFEPHVDGIVFRIREQDRFVNTSTLISIAIIKINYPL